jgi:hypothetical protein
MRQKRQRWIEKKSQVALRTSPTFSGELVWELMIIKGNKQKRQSHLTLPLLFENGHGLNF